MLISLNRVLSILLNLVSLVLEPSEKYEFVSWADEIPNMWKQNPKMFQTAEQIYVHGIFTTYGIFPLWDVSTRWVDGEFCTNFHRSETSCDFGIPPMDPWRPQSPQDRLQSQGTTKKHMRLKQKNKPLGETT